MRETTIGWTLTSILVAGLSIALTMDAGAETPTARAQSATHTINERARCQQVARIAERELGLDVCDVMPIHAPLQVGRAFSTALNIAGEPLQVDLKPHSNRGKNFQILVQHEDGSWTEQEPGPIITYRGTIKDEPDARVAATVMDDGVHGAVLMPSGDLYYFEPLALRLAEASLTDHVIYRSADISDRSLGLSCATIQDELPITVARAIAQRGTPTGCGGNLCVAELAVDTDAQYASRFGANTASRIELIINTVNMQYEAEVGITHDLGTILVRTGNFLYTATDPLALWQQFQAEWENNQTAIQRDVAHLFTGKDLNGNVVGFAPVGTICSNQGYSLSQHVDPFAKMTDLTAHELGHNWGAIHCTCPNHTMNATITSSNTFNPVETVPDIEAFRDSLACLSADTGSGLEIPWSDDFDEGVFNVNIWETVNSATISGLSISPPSGNTALRLDGQASVVTAAMDASELIDVTFEYWCQRQGGANRPEIDEDLVFEYQNAQNNWIEFARHLASDTTPNNVFVFNSNVLPAGAQHDSLRIRIRNPDGEINQDDWFVDSVSISGSVPLPEPFNLLSPADGAVDVPLAPSFQWSTSVKTSNYRIIVDDDPEFGSPEIDHILVSNFYSPPGQPLAEGRVYYWAVTAQNSFGLTESTPVSRSFTTAGEVPQPFFLALPVNASTITEDGPTFIWQESLNADSYMLEIDDDMNFGSPLLSLPALPNTPSIVQYEMPAGILADHTTYFWRVTAQNDLASEIAMPNPASFATDFPDPLICEGDANKDLVVDVNDISYVLFRLGDTGTPGLDGDTNSDGVVDVNDISYVLFRLGDSCASKQRTTEAILRRPSRSATLPARSAPGDQR